MKEASHIITPKIDVASMLDWSREAGSNGNDTMMVGNDDSTDDTETAPPVVIVF